MKIEEVKSIISKKGIGIYLLIWGMAENSSANYLYTSLASVGLFANGEPWFAPSNWINTSYLSDSWNMVYEMKLLISDLDKQNIDPR